MADDRMKNDDLQRNMGTTGEGQKYGQGERQQTPGRNPQGGQQGAGQRSGQKDPGQQKRPHNLDEDDDEFSGGRGNMGNRGQNR